MQADRRGVRAVTDHGDHLTIVELPGALDQLIEQCPPRAAAFEARAHVDRVLERKAIRRPGPIRRAIAVAGKRTVQFGDEVGQPAPHDLVVTLAHLVHRGRDFLEGREPVQHVVRVYGLDIGHVARLGRAHLHVPRPPRLSPHFYAPHLHPCHSPADVAPIIVSALHPVPRATGSAPVGTASVYYRGMAMNNADLIVASLKAAGIDRGFGVPSGNVLPLMDAMRAGGLPFVLTAHEGSAAFAADATARITGRPGLCIATLGPGATNLTTGVGSAWLDRSPMIAITCTLNEAQLGRRIQMWIDHQALFKPITKASFVLRRDDVAATLAEALRIALTEPQGPVHLDLPEDVALAPAQENPRAPLPVVPAARPDPAAIRQAAEIIGRARHPVVVVGMSAMRMQRPHLLREFVERHRIPFASTTMAKGLIDEAHPLALGCIERACRQSQRRFLTERADLVIGLGYDTIEVEYEAWIGRTPVLNVDLQAADVDASVTLAHEVVGDLDHAIAALAALPALGNAWSETAATEHREAFQSALRPRTQSFSPHEAIDVVRRVLPREGILAFDVGAHTHQIASQWSAHLPRSFLITNGWSSMGFGLPAAIAAKLARRDLPVVCIVGDGCFQMTCGELSVAKREKLAIPFVVLDDRWLSLIKVKQERRSLEHYGTALTEGGYQEPPAHYFGVPAMGVRSAAELEDALMQALRSEGPTVIEALVDPAHYSETVYD